jgi:excisionase family DNA binding protein
MNAPAFAVKPLYTTAELARLIGVSPKVIANLVDNGLIKGFRIPGSRHRRIPHEAAVAWLKEQPGMEVFLEQIGRRARPDRGSCGGVRRAEDSLPLAADNP